jgi:hypothetical protein
MTFSDVLTITGASEANVNIPERMKHFRHRIFWVSEKKLIQNKNKLHLNTIYLCSRPIQVLLNLRDLHRVLS